MINNIDKIIKLLAEFTKPFKVPKNNYVYDYYVEAKDDIKELNITPLTKEQIHSIFNDSKFLERYVKSIKDIQQDRLYKSYDHGINHNIRVSIFVYIMANFENVSMREFEMLMECAKYHDIGRTCDRKDDNHGLESAKKLDFLSEEYSVEELNMMKVVITCHSLDDIEIDKYMAKYNIQDRQLCKKLYYILKDADGLDRVRLHYPKIIVDMLRTKTAKQLVLFAFELYVNLSQKFEGKD